MGQLLRDHDAAYLAGHLDGDGSITSNGNGYFRVQWISTHLLSLNEIERMLQSEHITARLKKVGSNIYCLCIYRQDECKFALEWIAPYLVKKSDRAWMTLGELGSRQKPRKISIDWDYLAGFTDTDGHLTQQRRWKNGGLTYRIGWTQKDKLVLPEISEFLSGAGISSSLSYLHSRVWQLRVVRQGEILLALEEMLPYLVTKAAKAKQTIFDVQERWELCTAS